MVNGGKVPRTAGACDFCGSQIPVPDFQEGRASVVSGRICCACCLDGGAWFGARKAHGTARPVCRTTPRFVPSAELDLTLRLAGWRGVLYGNMARQWLDVSVEGLRAVVGRRCAVGDLFMARITHRPAKEAHEIVSTVRNVQESRKVPGEVVAGFLFANPMEKFRSLIRSLYGAQGIVDSAPQAEGKNAKKIG